MTVDETTFDFDSFFVDANDTGATEDVTVRGKTFQVVVKRGVNFGEREAAKTAATMTHLDPKGALVIDGFDNGIFTLELMARMLKSWTLPRPLNRATIASLSPDVGDAIMAVVQKYTAPTEEALAPFAPPSDAA